MANSGNKQVPAGIDPYLWKAFEQTLVDNDLAYNRWLEKCMIAYTDPLYRGGKRDAFSNRSRLYPIPAWAREVRKEKEAKAAETKVLFS